MEKSPPQKAASESARDAHLDSLMAAAQSGDAPAYLQLLEEITPKLRRIVRRRRAFLATEDIEDLVQDILLSVHAVRATYDSSRPFMPWLLAIARNRLADSARRYSRKGAREVLVDDLDVTFPEESTNTRVDAREDAEALHQAIGALPPRQRSAIEMLKLREMSLKEAAAASGMTVGALKVATHRAMGALRRALGTGK